MNIEILLAFLAIVAVSTYFQTITGFGLGMIVMGAASGLDLMPVAMIAAVNSMLSLANSAFALPGALHHIDWRITRAVLYGMLPAMVAGVLVLNYLDSYALILKLLLGLAIIYGGVSVIMQVAPGARRVSFMWSYPNMMPLPAAEVRRVAARLAPLADERI